jgi:hypothetical protein
MNTVRVVGLVLFVGALISGWISLQHFEESRVLTDEARKLHGTIQFGKWGQDPDAGNRLIELLGAAKLTDSERRDRDAWDRLVGMADREADHQDRIGRYWLIGGAAAVIGGCLIVRPNSATRDVMRPMSNAKHIVGRILDILGLILVALGVVFGFFCGGFYGAMQTMAGPGYEIGAMVLGAVIGGLIGVSIRVLVKTAFGGQTKQGEKGDILNKKTGHPE